MTTLVSKHHHSVAAEAIRDGVAWLRHMRAALRPDGSGAARASEIGYRVAEGRRRIHLSLLDPRL